MPWKLILYLVILGVILVFVGLNIGNTADISFGFHVFEQVPVFVGLFFAFFLGVLVTLPVAIKSSAQKTRKSTEKRRSREQKREEKTRRKTKAKSDDPGPGESTPTPDA